MSNGANTDPRVFVSRAWCLEHLTVTAAHTSDVYTLTVQHLDLLDRLASRRETKIALISSSEVIGK